MPGLRLLTLAWMAESDQENAKLGRAVGSAGDVNADGYDDVLVSAYLYDDVEIDEGRVWLGLGGPTGPEPTASWTATSDQAAAWFGNSAAAAGDVNGDGYDDVVIGAPHYDGDFSGEGRAYLFAGSASGLDPTPAWTAESSEELALFGFDASSAGDVNGDGFDDVLIGAYYGDVSAKLGGAFVYHGSASGPSATSEWAVESEQAYSYFGSSVSGAGDVDGDGFDEVVVGAPGQNAGTELGAGTAFLFAGSATGLETDPVWTFSGVRYRTLLGEEVAGAGDVNGDGFDDVAVGALADEHGEVNEGAVYVFHGGAEGLAATASWIGGSDQGRSLFGSSVASAGDVDADGFGDLVVGAIRYEDGPRTVDEGGAALFVGSPTGLGFDPVWTVTSGQEEAWMGSAVASAGDVNSDGQGDLIVAAEMYDHGESDEGRAFLFLGMSDR